MSKLQALLIAAALLIAGFACEKKPMTLSEAESLAASSGKPLLIDFATEW